MKRESVFLAVMLGLSGADPEYIPVESIDVIISAIKNKKEIFLGNEILIPFCFETDIVFNRNFLPFHANGLTFIAKTDTETYSETYYSIGGGFVVKEKEDHHKEDSLHTFPFPVEKADELLAFCAQENKKISEIVYENEKTMRSEEEIHNELLRI